MDLALEIQTALNITLLDKQKTNRHLFLSGLIQYDHTILISLGQVQTRLFHSLKSCANICFTAYLVWKHTYTMTSSESVVNFGQLLNGETEDLDFDFDFDFDEESVVSEVISGSYINLFRYLYPC